MGLLWEIQKTSYFKILIMRFIVVFVFLAIVIFVVVFGLNKISVQQQQTETGVVVSDQALEPQEINISISEENMSKEKGVATIKEIDGKTNIIFRISGYPEGVIQPSYIYAGECRDKGSVVYVLKSVAGGKSETTIDVSFDQLTKQFPLSIKIHKAPTEMGTVVACGDISSLK